MSPSIRNRFETKGWRQIYMEQFGVGVIGCGAISGNHFHAVQKTENAVIRAVCDIDQEKLQKAVETLGVENIKSAWGLK